MSWHTAENHDPLFEALMSKLAANVEKMDASTHARAEVISFLEIVDQINPDALAALFASIPELEAIHQQIKAGLPLSIDPKTVH